MRLCYREIGAAERERFNAFIRSSPRGHILQSYEWGEVKAATGWEPLRLVVEREKPGGEIVAAVSVLKRRLPGLPYSIFYAPRGPAAELEKEEEFSFLLRALRETARKHRAIFLKIDPDLPAEDEKARCCLESFGFRPAKAESGFEGVQPRFVFRLDISPSEEELLANMAGKTRYNLRIAQRRGVTVRQAKNRGELAVFYRILVETAQRDRFLIRNYSYFETLWDCLVERGLAALFLAEYEGEVIAGTLAFIFGDKAWYIYGASSNRHRNVMPNYLLQWEMICWAKRAGCRLYDFRGVPGRVDEQHPLYGLYRFKKGFGGVYTEFIGEHDLVYRPLLYWAWNWGEPLYRRGVRRLLGWKRRRRGEKAPLPSGDAGL